MLAAYAKHGLTTMLELDEWQLTKLGLRSIQWDRSLVEFKPFFVRRRVPIEQYSTWELMDLLQEDNWSFVQYVPRITPSQLCINQVMSLVISIQAIWLYQRQR